MNNNVRKQSMLILTKKNTHISNQICVYISLSDINFSSLININTYIHIHIHSSYTYNLF